VIAPPPRRAATAGTALALVAATMALLGQHLLRSGEPLDTKEAALVAAAYGAAILAFLWLAREREPEVEAATDAVGGAPVPAPWRPSVFRDVVRGVPGDARSGVAHVRGRIATAPVRSALVCLAGLWTLVGVALLVLRGDLPSEWDVFGLWLAAMAVYVAAFLSPAQVASVRRPRAFIRAHREALLEAGVLLAFALALRVPGLGSAPDVLGGDEGLVGLVARGMTQRVGNMFSTSFAYGNLYHLAVAVPLTWFGSTAFAVRLVAATVSALAAPLTYLAGRELFGRRVGRAAGVLILASHMHIHMSRTAHAQGIDTVILAGVLWCLARGMRRGGGFWFALGGVALGMAQYVYVAARLVDLIILGFAIALAVLDPPRWRRALPGFLVMLGSALVTAAPMIVWAVHRPGDYLSRVTQIGVLQGAPGVERALAEAGSAWRFGALQVVQGALAPIAYPAHLFYEARLPMLDTVWAALYVLGLALALRRVREWRYLVLVLTVLGAMALLALGNMVTTAVYRTTVALPCYALLAALALVTLAEQGLGRLDPSGTWPAIVIAGTVATMGGYNAGYYFFDHLPNCRYMASDDATSAVSKASMYVAARAPDAVVVDVTQPAFFVGAYPNAEYLLGRKTVTLGASDAPLPTEPKGRSVVFSVPEGMSAPKVLDAVGDARPVVFMVSPLVEGQVTIDRLMEAEPGGQREELMRCGHVLMDVYVLPRPRMAGD
jgi:4-amino-4-deoxy-L-arabinose transferase-like glycosyltransferase